MRVSYYYKTENRMCVARGETPEEAMRDLRNKRLGPSEGAYLWRSEHHEDYTDDIPASEEEVERARKA